MIMKYMSIFIGSMLVMAAAQAQELTDSSTWKYVNDSSTPPVIDYKKSNYEKNSGKPKNNLLNINGSLDNTMFDAFYGLVPDGVAIDSSLLGSSFNNISV